MNKEILGTGLDGLVGSRVVELNPQYEFINLIYPQADITKIETLETFFQNSTADTLIHFAAFTDTKAAWEQKFDTNSPCFKVNVEGTKNVAQLCKKYNKHLIHISTDYVFNGQKNVPYNENDLPNAMEWYGQTKAMAEKIALDAGATVVRISFPYRKEFPLKVDFIRGYINKLQSSEPLNLFTDQTITPTFIDDIAHGLDIIIQQKPAGIFHLVGSSSHSPYEIAQEVARIFNLDSSLIHPSSLEKYLIDNPTARPFGKNQSLSNQKIKDELGISMRTLTNGLEAIK
ncbi:SDR family oxidoreductase [Candidatus Shapirobacteria bacterium]|nr:SDR family oxidoreductase [Candidatus Shapirobacteria bacterium]